MSTFFFKTDINSLGRVSQLKPVLDEMEREKSIEHWHIDLNSPEYLLEIETNKLSPEKIKHIIRETGVDADFTIAPQAR
jgi:hypothetical protein